MLLIADSSVLINFLRVNRLDILVRQSQPLYIVAEVVAEIIVPEQKTILAGAIHNKNIEIYDVTELEDLLLGARLREEKGLGAGEAYSFPAARRLGATLCIDDKVAIKRAMPMVPGVSTLSTPDIIVQAIMTGNMEISDADSLKDEWHANGPRFSFSTFADLLSS